MRFFSLRRLSVSPWALIWLTLVWVLLWGEFNAMNILGGLVVGMVVLVVFPLPHVRIRLRPRLIPLIILVLRFLYDLVRSSVEVAWMTVRRRPNAVGVVMDLELAGDDALLQTLTAQMATLVPGSVAIDVDPENRLLTLHALGVRTRADAERMRRTVRGQEARILRALHPDAEELLNPHLRRERQRKAAADETDRIGDEEVPS